MNCVFPVLSMLLPFVDTMASPAWSITIGLGKSAVQTGHSPKPWTGSGESIKVNGPPLNQDPPIRPANETESSPTAILGLSQRLFHYAAGLAVNESIEVSAHPTRAGRS